MCIANKCRAVEKPRSGMISGCCACAFVGYNKAGCDACVPWEHRDTGMSLPVVYLLLLRLCGDSTGHAPRGPT